MVEISMQALFEERNLHALQEMVNGLVKLLKVQKLVVISREGKQFTSFEVEATFIEDNEAIILTNGVDRHYENLMVVQLAESPPSGQGITPKWLWDAYEGGATIIRIRPSSENLGNSFIRRNAQEYFEKEISLPAIIGGLMIPPMYCEAGILLALYNKRIENSKVFAKSNHRVERPHAILATYNERDIIEESVEDLIEQGCDVFVLDNWSDDGTYEALQSYLCKFPDRVISIVRFPEKPSSRTSLTDIVIAKEEIAAKHPGRWIINADADEFRRSPFAGLNLAEALNCAALYGANRVNFTVLNFRPVDDGVPEAHSYRNYFRYFELPDHGSYFVQSRAWLQPLHRIDLASSAGHIAKFDGAADFPFRFWMKHIPIRSPLHAAKKIVGERAKRWSEAELQKGWHTHYSKDLAQSYIWAAESLHRFNESTFDVDYSVMLATPLAKFFSPMWNGHRSVMRRWVDEDVIRTVNHQNSEIAELKRKHDVVGRWLKSLDSGVNDTTLESMEQRTDSPTLRQQLNSTLRSFLTSSPLPKRRIFESKEDYEERILNKFFFSNNWYIHRYPDVSASGMTAALHYLKSGAKEGRDPTSYFSTLTYLIENPDVAADGINPLLHFLLHGAQEGRNGVHRII